MAKRRSAVVVAGAAIASLLYGTAGGRRVRAISYALSCVWWRRFRRGPVNPKWGFQLELVIEIVRNLPFGHPKIVRQLMLPGPVPPWLKNDTVKHPGIRGEWIGVKATYLQPLRRVVLCFHGGGYCFGSVASSRVYYGLLAKACDAKCLAIDYRLAPEHPYPAALEDALVAYNYLIDSGVPPANIILHGDSAGGNLAVALVRRLKELNKALPACGILISPWVDLSCPSDDSWEEYHDIDMFKSRQDLLCMAEMYAGQNPKVGLQDPRLSPTYADDLGGLPPMMVVSGGSEVLLGQINVFCSELSKKGVSVDHSVHSDMPHAFPLLHDVLPHAHEAISAMGDYAKRMVPVA